jgi:hypothetical protein
MMLSDEQIYVLGAVREKSRNTGEIADRVSSMSLGKTVLTREAVDVLVESFLNDGHILPTMPRSLRLNRQRFEITIGGRAALTDQVQHVLNHDAAVHEQSPD